MPPIVAEQEVRLGFKKDATKRTASFDRAASINKMMRKEAALRAAFRSERGLQKIGAALANPVKKHLDYVPVGRRFSVVEPYPDGLAIYYDADIPEFTATLVGANGSTGVIECTAGRVFMDEIEFVVRPVVPYRELYIRKYKVLNRAKERLQQGIGLREDLYIFAALHTAATATNTEQVVATTLTKHALAKGFTQIERHRLIVKYVLLSPYGIQGIRRWQWADLDETAREEIRKTGYLGSLWNADFYISDQILYDAAPANTTYAYIMTEKEKLAWFPIRKDADVTAADQPWYLYLGFVGYELAAFTVHNSWGVARVKFDATGDL